MQIGKGTKLLKRVWKAVTDKKRYFHDQIFRGVILKGRVPANEFRLLADLVQVADRRLRRRGRSHFP